MADLLKDGIDKRIAVSNKQRRLKIVTYVTSAAAIVLFIVSFLILTNYNKGLNTMLTVQTTAISDSVLLMDGTVVYLSPHSSFSYPEKFGRKKRNVELINGNVFFKVARNPQKPFVITSGEIKTKVLGTSFNIHMNNEKYYVMVHTGKVNVSSQSESVDLLPLQEARYSKHENSFKVVEVEEQAAFPWYNSDITLTNQSISTILRIVTRKYGLENYSVSPEELAIKATVFIEKEATLESVIEQINYITNLKLYANEGIITNANY